MAEVQVFPNWISREILEIEKMHLDERPERLKDPHCLAKIRKKNIDGRSDLQQVLTLSCIDAHLCELATY